MKRPLSRALLAVAALLAAGSAAAQTCPAGSTQVTWPSVGPVWDFCFVRPAISPLAAGEGITLTNVKYKGVLILGRLSIPVLNVKYQSGCGPCYRDWLDQEVRFECAPTTSPGQCSGATTPARTTCQQPGADFGSFLGVAVEDKGTHLKLTSQTEAGWYRYILEYEFWPNGTIQTRMDATAVTDFCVQYTHNHHAYWRMDFDIAGSAGDFVDDLTAPVGSQRVATERNFVDAAGQRRRWRIGSAGTPYTVEVIRNPGDQATGDPPYVTNDFPIADGWALAYAANELSDQNVPYVQGCGIGLNHATILNGQNVDGADLVLWVRASGLHVGELGNPTPAGCEMFGPTIRVHEQALTPSSFHTVTPCRVLDTRNPAGPLGAPPLAANADRNFTIAGQCAIPGNARAVAANVTVTEPATGGHLQITPTGGPMPLASAINFATGQTRANNATIPLGEGGAIVVRSVLSGGSVHFLLDVTGYYD